MKKRLLALIFCTFTLVNYGQSNKEIANVYIKRALESIENSIDYESALEYFEKAMKYSDTITDRSIAVLGSRIYYEIHHRQETLKERLEFLEIAEKYSKQYFNLTKNSSSEQYINQTEDYVLIQEDKEKLLNQIKEEQIEEKRKRLELKRIDSLKTVWAKKSESLSIKADSIYAFNKNNIALYKIKDFYGIISDVGEILVTANEYRDVVYFDGYFIFKNKPEEPTKLFCFDSNAKSSFQLMPVSDFNTLSTHYGKVMLPRANGRLVTYPNNSFQPFVYDLTARKVVKIANEEDLFKNLKKADAIDKFNNDGEVKVLKEWYLFGGHLGGGIHPLYSTEGYKLLAFLCSIDGKVLNTNTDYQFIGSFYNGRYQAISSNETYWINQNGTKVTEPKNENGTYTGITVITKLENGTYQFTRNGLIILGNEQLEKMVDYLRKFQKTE